MVLKKPEKMEDLVYFTRRTLEPKGRIMAWAFKKMCPECKKALMGKPVEGGKVRIRATEYVCPSCNYSEEKKVHEDSLKLGVEYVCPGCSYGGEIEIPFKRKTWQGVKAFVFECGKCKTQIGVTKKMKVPKKKGSAASTEYDDEDD